MLSMVGALLALLVASSATPTHAHSNNIRQLIIRDTGATPIPPKQDPFYTEPVGFEASAPGTVLRLREAPGNLTATFNASSAVYNILYRTTNSQYLPAWAVTTVFMPLQSNNTNATLLSYQIPYNTGDVDASPSYALYSPTFSTGIALSEIQAALEQGWYVNIPDFEGPTASFASGVSEGHAVLDSIRAALSSNISTLTADAQYAMWGYSGGLIASEWAAELAVQYAPEMHFSGMAIGGLVANLTDFFYRVDGTPASGLIPAAILGLTNQFPEAYEFVLSNLHQSGPYNATGFLATQNYSYIQAAVVYGNQSVLEDYFVDGRELIQSPLFKKRVETEGQMGFHGVPTMPVYVYKAVQDEYTGVEYTDALVERYCSVGANVTSVRNLRGNHLDEYTNGDPGALEWLISILSEPVGDTDISSGGCVMKNVTVGTQDHDPFWMPPM